MRMRWPGFRKVRKQVCKRISRRIEFLGLPDEAAYRSRLESNPDEWKVLDSLCRITISRFYRDRGVFDHIGGVVLPRLAERVQQRVSCWSAGCASGEEAYTVRILWELCGSPSTTGKDMRILGTDADRAMLERAGRAVYPASAIKELPPDLTSRAFGRSGGKYALRERFKEKVRFEEGDIRGSMPRGPFDLVLCRNLVFTYYEESLQIEILRGISALVRPGGVLVIGLHESLPVDDSGLVEDSPAIYERIT